LELLHVLETQKNDAVLFTFRQSSENFTNMFKKLVPSGHAQLTMKTSENDSVPIENVSNCEMSPKLTSFKCDTFVKHIIKPVTHLYLVLKFSVYRELTSCFLCPCIEVPVCMDSYI
jgi:aldehyde:ferredoxin oxidoreductase